MRVPIFYEKLLQTTIKTLSECGLDSVKANEYAQKAAFNFCQENGGDFHQIPTLKCLTKQERDNSIREDSKTMDSKQLERKYKLSRASIMRALK